MNFIQPELFSMTNSNSWNKVKNIENSMKTNISNNKDTLYYKDIIPAFFEICSSPTYYAKLASLGLVKKTTRFRFLQSAVALLELSAYEFVRFSFSLLFL